MDAAGERIASPALDAADGAQDAGGQAVRLLGRGRRAFAGGGRIGSWSLGAHRLGGEQRQERERQSRLHAARVPHGR